MRVIVLDTETTGLDPAKGHRIIELACVEIRNRLPTGRSWHWYFNPCRAIDEGAFRVHGLTEQFLQDYPKFFEAAEDILDIIGNDPLVIHNAPFDVGFLNAEFGRLPLYPSITMDRVIDTLEIARKKFPGRKNDLSSLCQRFKIDTSRRIKHSAMLDTQLLTKVYLKLNPPEQMRLDLENTPSEEFYVVLARPESLESRLTAQELQAHAALVAGLGENAIWNQYD